MTNTPQPMTQDSAESLPPPMVDIRKVGISFPGRQGGTSVEVLSDIDLQIARGECMVVIGPSGCGKSTLMSCVAGLTRHTSGEIFVDGFEVNGPNEHLAVVFQQASLLPWRTVRGNVRFGLEVRRELPKEDIAERVTNAIDAVGLTDFAEYYPHQISGGMQQRVNLARAFAMQAPLILMDEPFGALDALTKESMQDELVGLMARASSSTMFITHDIREAIYLGDEIVVMSRRPGRIAGRFRSPFGANRTRKITEDPRFDALESQLRSLLDHDEMGLNE